MDYITKPFECEEVLARIQTHLTLRNLHRQLCEQNMQLQEQNTRFQQLSRATFEGIVIYDEHGILDVNDTLAAMFGYAAADITGTHFMNLIAPPHRERVFASMHANDDTLYESEGLRKTGMVFPVEIQTKAMPYQGRKARVAAVRDLSRQKTLEAERAQLQRENVTLKTTIRDRYKFGNMIGKSLAMQQVYELIVQAAACDDAVIIYGESGTGKELAAQTIHRLSPRREHAFIPVNCGAIVETLFEREFFGHRKGAFTGADATQPGFFEAAHQGDLFLDEVGELPPFMQVKLLRALEYGEYTPVGSTTSKQADVRIITATNKNLNDLRNTGLLREDFFYRIHIIPIRIPPLRERKEDIPLLVEHFLTLYGHDALRLRFSPGTFQAFAEYEWPGNVRELQNTLKRYLATEHLDFIGTGTDSEQVQNREAGMGSADLPLNDALDAFEKHLLARTLSQCQWNKTKAAEKLGVSRQSLLRRIEKYGLHPDDR